MRAVYVFVGALQIGGFFFLAYMNNKAYQALKKYKEVLEERKRLLDVYAAALEAKERELR